MKTCIVHGIAHSSNYSRVLKQFGTKYAAAQSTKYHWNNPVTRKIFQKKQENHAIINYVMDEILFNEPQKVSYVNHEAPEFLDNYKNENDLYQVKNMILDETKEKID